MAYFLKDDPEGNRISQTDSKGTTHYLIDTVSALPRVLSRTLPDGSTTYYIYGVGLAYQINSGGTTHTYHYDHLGNTIALTDDDGEVTDRWEYSPYGIVTHREGSTDTPFQYSGQHGVMTDSNGLIHMRARYYNPTIRRFINADPIGFEGGTNWYLYANGNPVMYVDPSGNVAFLIAPLISGLVGFTADVAIQVALGEGTLTERLSNVNYAESALTGLASATGFTGLSAISKIKDARKASRILNRVANKRIPPKTFSKSLREDIAFANKNKDNIAKVLITNSALQTVKRFDNFKFNNKNHPNK